MLHLTSASLLCCASCALVRVLQLADLQLIGLSETQVDQFAQRNLMQAVWSAQQAVA